MVKQFKTMAVLGVGLIGGSFALALKQAGQIEKVIGVGRSLSNLQQALTLGVIDEIAAIEVAVAQADLIFLAVPVGQMEKLLPSIVDHLPPHALVMDAGSTKENVVDLFKVHAGEYLHQFIPAHPIAGSEQSGAAAAQADLYQNRHVVLTPLPENQAQDLDAIQALWEACGAKVERMQAEQHDQVFATVSHLPHLLSFAYVEMVRQKDNAEECFHFAATGFRDFTRIAGSHPEMWRDICLSNKKAILYELDAYKNAIERLQKEIAQADEQALHEHFTSASASRGQWLARFNQARKNT